MKTYQHLLRPKINLCSFWGLFIVLNLFTNYICFAQNNYIQSFEKTLTPSPMVTALGNYGGLDVKKNSGGIQKSIGLLAIKEGDLSYNPSIEYFSTGIKVNDWGSRVGIGWTEKTTAVITRTVRNIPDEKATSRVGDGALEFGDPATPAYSLSDYNKVVALADPLSLKDGEYDLFNFNIFGESGEFIIRNNAAILLNNDNSFKIQIVQTSPNYQFILTNRTGIKYYFTSNIEFTNFDNDNACDQDNPNTGSTATAWFIDQIVSPTTNTIHFNYNDAEYSYLYDYNEYYTMSDITSSYICDDPPPDGGHNYCLRRKHTHTKILSSVTGDNFSVNLEYKTRDDIYNEQLLDNITFFNHNSILKQIQFVYTKVTATTTFEPVIESSLPYDPWEHNALKTRYFLDSLKIGNGQGAVNQVYKFGYVDPTVLPHRFALSQDYIGCYNGKPNQGLVPHSATDGFTGYFVTEAASFHLANRDPFLIGQTGLLNKIVYPTGGTDSIVFEQNKFRTTVINEHHTTFSDWFENEDDATYTGGFTTMHIPRSGEVKLKIECYYNSDDPKTHPDEDYWADIELWDSDSNHIQLNGQNTVQIHLGQTFYSDPNPNLSIPGILFFDNDKDYDFRVNIYGKHTTLRATLYYVDTVTTNLVDSTYVGFRVKQVITRSITSPDQIKSYNYNIFYKNNDQLTLTDASSLVVKPLNDFLTVGEYLCTSIQTGGVPSIPVIKLSGRSNIDPNAYGGLPYAYQNVTEFQDNNQSSFIASQFLVFANTPATRMLIDHYPYLQLMNPELDNVAWNHGLEVKRYYGGKANNIYSITRENNWSYSAQSTTFSTYGAYKIMTVMVYTGNPRSDLGWYVLKGGAIYSHFVKLDTLTQIDYFKNPSGYRTVMNKTLYRYNADDKQAEEEESLNSKGETLLKQTYRPYKMVSLGRDPSGVYQEMIDNHIIAPEIEVTNKKNSVQTSLVRTNYSQPLTGLYVPESIVTQQASTDPVVTRLKYLRYDTRGNVLSLSTDGGPAVNYIWSYKSKYPVAQITNVDYSSMETTLGASAISTFATTYPIKSDVDSFLAPLFSTYPKAQISSFSYIPQIGMKSQTDAKGLNTYYIYDPFQRLESILDQNGNVVKSYLYNFKQH